MCDSQRLCKVAQNPPRDTHFYKFRLAEYESTFFKGFGSANIGKCLLKYKRKN